MTDIITPNIDASGQFIRSAPEPAPLNAAGYVNESGEFVRSVPAPARPDTGGYVNDSGEFVRGVAAPQPKKVKKNADDSTTNTDSDLKLKIRERLLGLDLS